MQEFQLRVVPTDNNNFAIELYQCAYKKAGEKKRPAAKRIGRLKSSTLIQVREMVYNCLKANKYDPKTLNYNRQAHYILNEETGVNLALLFQTIQPLSKIEKINNIAEGIQAMSYEESHYWFAKISNGKRSQALKAIRVLLGD
ncbi:hypothetical protein B7O87_09650 [Cylindrospermopsis raciborskii CENA303]|uniref:DUF7680 domain-containing protein n=1 Tax=Cylindrospermopsis raciborskii CENA303 TaxID=1170769 RepID=A0A1X4G6D7_9CYAN|nr:hypothetical protein [Cylindrospermopsis raciborskii]OSO90290.1 hypothetical protein B7O87_09650 [Cylindrospermopsis raciborskii CENA303]